jgi:small subunit ribosomal protein S35
MKFDNHVKVKLLRLVKERYNLETDVLTIVSERFPLRKQNVDYAMYLLSVLVSEFWVRPNVLLNKQQLRATCTAVCFVK